MFLIGKFRKINIFKQVQFLINILNKSYLSEMYLNLKNIIMNCYYSLFSHSFKLSLEMILNNVHIIMYIFLEFEFIKTLFLC